MFDRIGALADRILIRVAPQVQASASYFCWTERANSDGRVVCRRCCMTQTPSNAYITCNSWSVTRC
jgi:hypothetical protein